MKYSLEHKGNNIFLIRFEDGTLKSGYVSKRYSINDAVQVIRSLLGDNEWDGRTSDSQ